MKTRILVLAAVLFAAVTQSAAAADKYTMDTAHTNIGFGVKHMVVTTVKGDFNEFSGEVVHDPNDISKSSVNVTIAAKSVDTGNQKRDDHLRSEDFLTVSEYPEITFKSDKITKKGDDYVAHGKLTIRGVTKDVQIPFELNGPVEDPWGNTRIGIEGEIKINRRDYNLTYDNKIADGSLVVGDEVKIELAAEFIKAKKENS